MRLIDTHCHLCNGRLRVQSEAVLDRARSAGVVAFICASAHLDEAAAAVDLARRTADVFCTAGVHPHDAKDVAEDYLDVLERLAGEADNVAVGEIGLDYHYDYSPRAEQRRVFAEQLDLARRLGKRIIVHTREAFDDTMSILAEAGVAGANVVFHCCSEGPQNVARALDFGGTISFSGIVTFSGATDVRQAAAMVPDDRLLIETDSPFLSPEPVRKMKTNEPANVAHVAASLAALRGTTGDRLAELTTLNAVRLFGLDV